MITISNLGKSFSQRTLFKDVSLSIYPNEKIGLTGPNGSGKSTLFSIIRGDAESSAGTVQIQKNLNIGYLAQEAKFDSKRTVIEELTAGDSRIIALLDEKHKLEDENKADTDRYGDVMQGLELLGIYELEHKAEKILSGLGFKPEDFNKPIVTLSGGWQMRTLLAKLLTYPYDILLLDEPTNYLDLEATLWLKDFLSKYQGTFVLICHDKLFLSAATNYTILLENGQMTKIKGNYEQYEETKEIRNKTLEKQQKELEKKKDQLERFAQRFHAQPNRASAVRNKRKMLERLEDQEVEIPTEKRSIKDFEFPPTRNSGYVVMNLNNVAKAYGDKQIYSGLDFEVIRGQKICLVGPNGAGKSTLLKILAGVLPFDSGVRKIGHQVDLGYFSQTRLDVLNLERTVLDELASALKINVPPVTMRSLLGLFNYHGDDVFKYVKVLSGGEKSRLILAKLLINPPNFMCLDVPTADLDSDGVEALTTAFKSYEGTLCFISHDLFFVKEIANCIVEVNNGEIRTFPGGLDYYLEKRQELNSIAQTAKRNNDLKAQKEAKEERKSGQNQEQSEMHQKHQQALKRIHEIRQVIKNLEQEKGDLDTENYVKARVMSKAESVRDPEMLKEYGQRLKWIQGRLRDIEATVKSLQEERDSINK